MRNILIVIAIGATLLSATAADALTRYSRASDLYQRTLVGVHVGVGYPVLEFASSLPGDGNHDAGAIEWGVDLEHFVDPNVSLGLMATGATYDDKNGGILDEFGNLRFGETQVSMFGGFVRYVGNTWGEIHPFIRFGAGGMRVQFQDSFEALRSEWAGSFQAGGGLMGMLSDLVAITAQATYNHGFTEMAYVPADDSIVGFDTRYWSFTGGIALVLP